MTEKRKHRRRPCEIKTRFDYYEGIPFEIDMAATKPVRAKGYILDISRSGLFLVTDLKVAVGMAVVMKLTLSKKKLSPRGTIVRTGMLAHNPSEIAKKFSKYASKGETYIAIEFSELADIEDADLQ